MKKTILFVVVLLLCNVAMAQMKVTGKVTSDHEQKLGDLIFRHKF